MAKHYVKIWKNVYGKAVTMRNKRSILQLAHVYTQVHQGKRNLIRKVFLSLYVYSIFLKRLYNQIDLSKATEAEKNKLGLGAYSSKIISAALT